MNKTELQLINNLNDIFGGYANGMSDAPEDFPALNIDECYTLAIPEIYNMKSDGEGTTYYGKDICRNLRFLGKLKIKEAILEIASDCGVLKE